MQLPFTLNQFLTVFENYNLAVWPMQVLLNLLALTAIFFVLRKKDYSDKIVATILAFLWLWTGIAYHLIYFSSINKGAYFFGILYVIQGMLFLFNGVIKSNFSFKYKSNIYGITGGIFTLYALIIYPVLGYFLGHVYPKSPTFGLPCPTTIFTFGILLWTDKRVPKNVLIIPFLWSLIGFSAAISLHIREDFGLFLAGVLGFILILKKNK